MTRLATAAVIVLLTLTAGLAAARGAGWYHAEDFFCLYEGGRALATGHDPYDEAYWKSVTGGEYELPTFIGGVGTSPCPGRYGYPLWTAVASIPLGVLPVELAATLWASLSIGGVVAGMAWSWRAMRGPRAQAAVFATIVIASPMFWLLLISGQPTGVELALGGAVALALARARPGRAGFALAAMALKPQLIGVTLPAVLVRAARGERRLIAGAAVALALMTAAAMLFVPLWPLEWLGEASGRRLRVLGYLPTAWGLAADVTGNAALGAVLIAALVLVVVWLVRRRPLTTLDVFVLSLPISLFATPYAWSYDHLVLAPCWAFLMTRDAISTARLVMLLCVAMVAVVLPWMLYALAFSRGVETFSASIPAATAVLVALSLRITRRPTISSL